MARKESTSSYVRSGLWDGHFRGSDAREGLVLRSERRVSSAPLRGSPERGRFGRPLQPRWPFGGQDDKAADTDKAANVVQNTISSRGCTATLGFVLETTRTIRGSGVPSDCLGVCQDVVECTQAQRAQELLRQLTTYRHQAELNIARVWATLIKTAAKESEETRATPQERDEAQARRAEQKGQRVVHGAESSLLQELDMLRAEMRENLAMLEADAEAAVWCFQSHSKSNPSARKKTLQRCASCTVSCRELQGSLDILGLILNPWTLLDLRLFLESTL